MALSEVSMWMKQGDLSPALEILCEDRDGPIRLDLADSVQLYAAGAVTLDGVAMTGSAQGVATYLWQEGDTDTPGLVRIEVKINWADGTDRTLPMDGYLYLRIVPRLDTTPPAPTP